MSLLTVHADAPDLAFPAMCAVLQHEAEHHDLPILEHSAARMMIGTPASAFGIEAREEAGIRLRITARDDAMLCAIRDEVVAHLDHFAPQICSTLRWSDAPQPGARPKNFQIATVVRTQALGAAFTRLVLQLEHLSGFDDSAIHFRFALPQGPDPEWPVQKENGAIAWPEGDKALHRPVYTLRSQSAADRQIIVDVYHHMGGRLLGWSRDAQAGDQIGLLGPSGGGVPALPAGAAIILSGDETAYPATARILDSLPQEARPVLNLLTHGATDYPFPAHPGMQITWIPAQQGDLVAATQEAMLTLPGAFLWFAAETALIQKMRTWAMAQGIEKEHRYIASFWTAP